MNPPLREPEDREAIRQALRDGTIDVICTDHAPHHYDAKEREFDDAPNGIIGLETALGLAVTELVETGLLSLRRPGEPDERDAGADLQPARRNAGARRRRRTSWCSIPTAEWTVRPEEFFSKSRNTPFAGRRLKGRAETTIVRGQVVFAREPGGTGRTAGRRRLDVRLRGNHLVRF